MGEKTAVNDFFSFFEQYQSEYHCYSKCLALFCLEALDLQRQLSPTPAGQSAGVGWRRGSVHRVPLCCGPPGVKRQPLHSAALPPGLHLTLPPQVSQAKAAPPRLANRGSLSLSANTRHLQRGGWGLPPLDPAVVSFQPSPPISQFFDTKITLAGRCNSHISGIFASVLFIFLKRSFDFIFFNVLYCYFCLHAVVYENTGC